MAHSLRSKTKLKSKHIKTSNPNSDYYKAAEQRTERLAQKLKDNLEKQKVEKAQKDEENMNDDTVHPLDKPVEELAAVKTHGWRKSRTSDYKKKRASKRKNKTLKF